MRSAMKKISLVFSILVLNTSYLFAGPIQSKHHEHGAHSHGSAKLDIAFDDKVGKIEFKGSAFGIVGFEHSAKSITDKKILENSIFKFESEISKLVSFDSSLKCLFNKVRIEIIPDSDGDNHSDFAASFQVNCVNSPMGSQLKIDFSIFKNIKDLDITVLVGELQKSAEFKGKPVTLDLN
jgi:hypothetical protein